MLAAMSAIASLPRLDVRSPSYAADPLDALREAQRRTTVATDRGALLVLDENLTDQLVRDRRLEIHHEEMLLAVGITDPRVTRFRREMMLDRNGKEHTRLRGAVAAFFSPLQVAGYRSTVRELIDALLRAAPSDSPIDLFGDVCASVPSQVFCRLIDVPLSEAPFVTRISDSILKIFLQDPAYCADIENAYGELFAYVSELIAERRQALGDDLLSSFIRLEIDGTINEQELHDLVVMTLEASTDNTSHQMGMVLACVLDHPGTIDALRDDPGLIPTAVNEGIRLSPRVLALERVASEDLVIADVEVPAGTTVWLSALASHRSPRRYANPDAFDLRHEHNHPLLTFGGGAHRCLGAPLAQVEIEEMLRAIVEDWHQLRLVGPPRRFRNPFVQGIEELPVVLDG
jgi:cytochrome P450